ncbi:MAG: hypothetical protein ABJM29_04205 [Rhizobiaceae bacterium]
MTLIFITTAATLSCLAVAVAADQNDGPSVQDVETEKRLYGHFH